MRDPDGPSAFYLRAVARRRRGFFANLGIALMILVLCGAVAVARYAEHDGTRPSVESVLDGSA